MNTAKTIYIGADHGGFKLKENIKAWLEDLGYGVRDFGAYLLDPKDDYPAFAINLALEVVASENSFGILFCRSGGGMVVAANKVKGASAISVHDKVSAILARKKNNANMISISADWTNEEQVKKIILAFLETPISEEERHIRRIKQIEDFENFNQLEIRDQK